MPKCSWPAIFIVSIAASFGICNPISGQTPTSSAPVAAVAAPAAVPPAYVSDLGFVYNYPADWELVDSKPMMPTVRMQAEDKATSDSEKRAAQCLQVGLTVRHGSPTSVLIVIGVPSDCTGTTLKDSDLAGFGLGVATGINRSFDMKDPLYGAYKLGTHSVWIERAEGPSKAHPETIYTIETACVLLSKGAVCWMGMVKDADSLKAFEQSRVSIDGAAPQLLVPADVFVSKK